MMAVQDIAAAERSGVPVLLMLALEEGRWSGHYVEGRGLLSAPTAAAAGVVVSGACCIMLLRASPATHMAILNTPSTPIPATAIAPKAPNPMAPTVVKNEGGSGTSSGPMLPPGGI